LGVEGCTGVRCGEEGEIGAGVAATGDRGVLGVLGSAFVYPKRRNSAVVVAKLLRVLPTALAARRSAAASLRAAARATRA